MNPIYLAASLIFFIGCIYISNTWKFGGAESFVSMIFIMIIPPFIHEFLIKKNYPKYHFVYKNHPGAWKPVLLVYFLISVLIYFIFPIHIKATNPNDDNNGFVLFMISMSFAVPVFCVVSFFSQRIGFVRAYVDSLLDEIQPRRAPTEMPPEWTISGRKPESSEPEKFDPDRFKGPKP